MAHIVHTQRIVDGERPSSTQPHSRVVSGTRPVVQAAPRRRWPGLLAFMLLGAALAAVLVSNVYDPRSTGEKLDAATAAAGQAVHERIDALRSSAVDGGTTVAERAATTLGDAGITAAVKTALAADPTLSALQIDVDTTNGVVSLSGPAPDAKSRDRAEVIAAAPEGVQRVDNRLVVRQ